VRVGDEGQSPRAASAAGVSSPQRRGSIRGYTSASPSATARCEDPDMDDAELSVGDRARHQAGVAIVGSPVPPPASAGPAFPGSGCHPRTTPPT
jgi:hypothetical protein